MMNLLLAVIMTATLQLAIAPREPEEMMSPPVCCGKLAQDADNTSGRPVSRIDSATAKQLFERFKHYEGVWVGKSTKGWTDKKTIKTIAAGSAILINSFDAHPNETMLTLMHFDVNRLLMTHYCVAKNQPRLVATNIEENGNKVTFEFLDGTNLPSRDQGHMDKAIFRFMDENTFSVQWTWYQKGSEEWMEEITNERSE